jgi:hypothetical protein
MKFHDSELVRKLGEELRFSDTGRLDDTVNLFSSWACKVLHNVQKEDARIVHFPSSPRKILPLPP